MSEKTLLDIALELYERGFRVFPLGTPGERPPTYFVQRMELSKNLTKDEAYQKAVEQWPKAPRFAWKSLQEREPTEDEITQWWTQYPDANIGIVCGPVIVLDADSQETADWVANDSGITFTPYRVSTAQGVHFYYRPPHGTEIRNSVDRSAKLDVRGNGGYVVGPGSTHSTGVLYQEILTPGFDVSMVSDLPVISTDDMNLVRAFNGQTVVEPMPSDGLVDMRLVETPADARPALPGERNNHATSLAGQWISAGDSLQGTLQKLHAWNAKNPDPLPDGEIETVAASVATTHARNTGTAVPLVSESTKPGPGHKTGPGSEPDHKNTPVPATPDEETISPPVPVPPAAESAYTPPPPPPMSGVIGGPAPDRKAEFHDNFFTLQELEAKPATPLDNYWREDLIFSRSRLLIAGPPKIGKSRFCLHMAIQAAAGGVWLGSPFKRPLRVVWAQAEIREWHLRQRIEACMRSVTPTERVHVERNFMVSDRFDCNLLDPTDYALIDSVMERHRPEIFIFDPLVNFIDANENDAQEIGRAFRTINALEKKFNCSMVMIHHTRKLEKPRGKNQATPAPSFDDVRGSSVITGWPDTAIVLGGSDGQTQTGWMARACQPPGIANVGWNEADGLYRGELEDQFPLDIKFAAEMDPIKASLRTEILAHVAQHTDTWIKQGTVTSHINKLHQNQIAGTIFNSVYDELVVTGKLVREERDGEKWLLIVSQVP